MRLSDLRSLRSACGNSRSGNSLPRTFIPFWTHRVLHEWKIIWHRAETAEFSSRAALLFLPLISFAFSLVRKILPPSLPCQAGGDVRESERMRSREILVFCSPSNSRFRVIRIQSVPRQLKQFATSVMRSHERERESGQARGKSRERISSISPVVPL